MDHWMMQKGLLLGLLTGGIVCVLFFKITRKDGSLRGKYDERQRLVQGKGFKYGFWGCFLFNALYILADIGLEAHWMDTPMALFCGMMTGLAIYVSYCIWHEGYFSLNDNPLQITAMLAAVTFFNIICAASRIHEDSFFENGMLTFLDGSNMICGIVSGLALGVIAAKRYIKNRQNRE